MNGNNSIYRCIWQNWFNFKFSKNINIIPTGIEVERFFPENIDKKDVNALKKRYSINKKDFIIIFVGRLAAEKNIDFILEIEQELIKKHGNIIFLLLNETFCCIMAIIL